MLFNSLAYFAFLPTFFALYWLFGKRIRIQNALILVASYLFYGWWDWKFLFLIFLSTVIDFFTGIYIEKSQTQNNPQKLWHPKTFLAISMVCNLGFLGFFKYYNFFIEGMTDILETVGYKQNLWTLKIILPVGISFYTFQTMSYTIDVYKRKLKPTKDFISFAAFVAFFPQLVAGPIERATNLLPQITTARKFRYDQAVQGLRLILWGLWKKVMIADALSSVVDEVFSQYSEAGALALIFGAIAFSFQIYCDFSGYSDVAIGSSKLLGFELMSNFKFPFFSRNIGEFWRRWHISLSTWFRDYVYIPLGGSRKGKWSSLRNIFIIFLVSGFWHGADWRFLAWGFIHALLFVPSFFMGRNRKFSESVVAQNRILPRIKEVFQMGITFFGVCLAFVIFRSENLTEGLDYIYRIGHLSAMWGGGGR